jgi:hypothetical protein
MDRAQMDGLEHECRPRKTGEINRRFFARGRVSSCLGLLVSVACNEAKGVQIDLAPNAEKGPPLDAEGPRWTRVAPRLLREPEPVVPSDEPALRRAYSLPDMKLGPCATLEADGTIRGAGCAPGCVIFGPYVGAPGNSDVHVKFDLRAVDKLTFTSDVVSNAKLTHGALDPQTLAAGEKRAVGYRVHLTEGVKSIEARLWVDSEKPAAFQIANFTVTVE